MGSSGLPSTWRDGLWEWPRSVAWMTRLGQRLEGVITQKQPQPALAVPFGMTLVRNLVFLVVLLLHGLRRLLPPY